MQHYKNVSAIRNPHDLLFQIGSKVAKAIQSRDQGIAVQNSWNGVGFSLCGQKMVAQLGEIVEILPVPAYTRIYGSDAWLMGVANVRGALITMIDLEKFCGSTLSGNKQNFRVLVVQDGFSKIGLVVKNIFGLKSFDVNKFERADVSADEVFAKYIDGQIHAQSASSNSEKWMRFSIEDFVGEEQIGS